MKKNLVRILSLLLVMLLLLSAVAPLSACGGGENEDNNGDNNNENGDNTDNDTNGGNGDDGNGNQAGTGEKANYVVELVSAGQMPLDGVLVTVRNEKNIMEARLETDDNGKAVFELDVNKNYYIELDESALEGYHINPDNKYEMKSGGAKIVLTSSPIPNSSISNLPARGYQLGDIVHDFTITDLDGNKHSVSDVLSKKQLLVLNFWSSTCTYCYKEFPYLSSAYDKYSDKIEIFAINDYAADSVADAKNLAIYDSEGNLVTLNFPKFKVDQNMISKFDTTQTGYPVTVAIDRYGMISMVHIGGVIGEKYFTNMFDFFLADDYKQTIVTDMMGLAPVEKPNIDMPSSDVISDAFDKGKLNVTYHEETNPNNAEYSWPFIVTEKNGEVCIQPSNKDKDNSYAILYAEVEMEAGQALVFDYISSTQKNDNGQDSLYILVNGKDIYTIAGVSEDNKWKTCCTYVARESDTYTVSFIYQKDIADYAGDDTVYLKDLRIIDADEVDVETFIFRYVAEKPSADGKSYGSYANVVLNPEDGYYHIGDVNGPLLLADLLGYTNFDRIKTVFERAYYNVDDDGNVVFMVDGVNKFLNFEAYGNYASNSRLYGCVPVTEELKTYLIQYTNYYRSLVDKDESENLWLQLCCYYDAYGTGGKQMEDPIKGLTSFSAYDAILSTEDETVMNNVSFDRIIIPRGKLYSFVPEKSGVYRITSSSSKSVIGWIFTGDHDEWTARGDRQLYTDSSSLERLCVDLTVFSHYTIQCSKCGASLTLTEEQEKVTCPDEICGNIMTDLSAKKEVRTKDYLNISMLAYMEAGKQYYISLAFQTVEDTGSFDFTLKYEAEEFASFVQASPGPFTVDEITGSIIATGVNVQLCNIDGCEDCAEAALSMGAPEGTKYYHHKKADGTLGHLMYADFYQYTPTFTSQSILDLIKINAFNTAITETDRDALQYLEDMYKAGKEALFETWGNIPTQKKIDKWNEYCVEALLFGRSVAIEGDMLKQAEEYAEFVTEAGKEFLKKEWGADFDDMWFNYEMDDIIEGKFHGNGVNYTNTMLDYADKMLDEADHPERQGCVPVDETLATILQHLMDRYTFENVPDAWRKLCYYYNVLG